MNVSYAVAADPKISSTDEPEGLFVVRRPDCDAVIWNRTPLQQFQSRLDMVQPSKLPKANIILDASRARTAVSHICDLCESPDCPERAMLVDDIAALADILSRITRAQYVRMRLGQIDADLRRGVQTEARDARLICAYRGAEIRYDPSNGGARPLQVVMVPTGSLIIIRGSDCLQQPQSDALHGSPSVVGTEASQLVLVLEPVNAQDRYPAQSRLH